MKTYTAEWLLQHIFPVFICPIMFLFILNEALIQDLWLTWLYRGSLIVFISLGAGEEG